MGAIRVERGTVVFGAGAADTTEVTLGTAPTDNNWFVRITNTQKMSRGPSAGTSVDKTPADLGVQVLRTGINTFSVTRRSTAENADYAYDWEAWIYQAGAGDDNEIIVSDWTTTSINGGQTAPPGDNPVAVDTNINKIVPIILAIDGRETSQDFSGTAVTAEINTVAETVEFRRSGDTNTVTISYAIVEFKGPNWSVNSDVNTLSSTASTTPLFISFISDWSNTFFFSTFRNDDPNQASLSHAAWPGLIVNLLNERVAGGTALNGESVTYFVENAQLSVEHDNSLDGNADDPLASDTTHSQTISTIASADAGLVAHGWDDANNNDWPQTAWSYRWASATSIEFERSRANGGSAEVFYSVIDFSGLPFTPPTPTAQGYQDLSDKIHSHYNSNFAAFTTQLRNLPFVRPDASAWVNLMLNFLQTDRIALDKDAGRYKAEGELVAKYFDPYKSDSSAVFSLFGDPFIAAFSDTQIAGVWFQDAYLRETGFSKEQGQFYYEFVAPFTWSHSVNHSARSFSVADGYENLYDALNGRFATLVATPQGVSTEYGNLPFQIPTNGDMWARFNVLTARPNATFIGERRIPGTCVVQIFQAMDTGDSLSLGLADVIVEKFVGGVEENVVFGSPSVRSIGNDGNGWWQTNVSVPFLHLES